MGRPAAPRLRRFGGGLQRDRRFRGRGRLRCALAFGLGRCFVLAVLGVGGFVLRVLALVFGILARALDSGESDLGWNMPRTRARTRRVRACRPAFGLEDFGLAVVGDVVAADLVLAALQERAIEELDQLLRAVVLDASARSLRSIRRRRRASAGWRRVAVGGGRQRVVGVLLEHDAVGADRQRALRDDHVPVQRAAARLRGWRRRCRRRS